MYDELIKRMRDSEHEIDCSICDRDCCYPDGKVHGKCIIIEAADAIEALFKMEKTTQWIPVTERLPKDQRPVLVYVPSYTDGEEEYVGYVGMAYFTYSPNGGFWCGTDGNIYGAIGIIHEPLTWMPFPEPPKEGEI